jgi:ankyrin repeat protein
LPGLQDSFGRSALHWCCQQGDEQAAVALLQRSQSLAALRTTGGETPLHWVVSDSAKGSSSARLVIAKALLAAGADPLASSVTGVTPLSLASSQHQLHKVLQEAVDARATAQELADAAAAAEREKSAQAEAAEGQSAVVAPSRVIAAPKKKQLKIILKKPS